MDISIPNHRTIMKPFRSFVYEMYYMNRDEYEQVGQKQPYTVEEYYLNNKSVIISEYRLTRDQ